MGQPWSVLEMEAASQSGLTLYNMDPTLTQRVARKSLWAGRAEGDTKLMHRAVNYDDASLRPGKNFHGELLM
jgi:hypothetical protein